MSASTDRHHYTLPIPGASLLTGRSKGASGAGSSSKVWAHSVLVDQRQERSSADRRHRPSQQNPASYAAPASRDTRHAPQRAYTLPVAQEPQPSRSGPTPRPPSTNGYRTQQQHPSAYVGAFPTPIGQPTSGSNNTYGATGSLRAPPPLTTGATLQRTSTSASAPAATGPPHTSSSSKTSRLEVPDTRGYLSRMFGRKPSGSSPAAPQVPQTDEREKHKSASASKSKHRERTTSVQVVPISSMYPTATAPAPEPPQTAPPTNSPWGMYDQSQAQSRGAGPSTAAQRDPRDVEREQREDRERAKQKAKEDKHKEDRYKSDREDRYKEERYKSDREERARAERAREERQRAEYAAYKARVEAEQARVVAEAQAKATKGEQRPSSRRDERRAQEYESDRDPSRRRAQSQVQAPQVAPTASTGRERRSTMDEVVGASQSRQVPNNAPPPNASQYLSPSYQLPTNPNLPRSTTPAARDSQQTPIPHPAVRHLGVPIQPSTSSQSTVSASGHGHAPYAQPAPTGNSGPPPASKFSMYLPSGSDEKARVAKEAEREREREKEREKERRKAQEKEEKRARREERERRKELERADRERRKELERTEKERERQREKEKERERERQNKLTKHRSGRDKTLSLPTHPSLAGVTSGSENERSDRRDNKHHRSQSHTATATNILQPSAPAITSANEMQQRSDSHRDAYSMANNISGPQPSGVPALKSDPANYARGINQSSTATAPTPMSIASQNHEQVLYPRSASNAPMAPVLAPTSSQKVEVPAVHPRSTSEATPPTNALQSGPPKPPDRSRTEPILQTTVSSMASALAGDGPLGSGHTTVMMTSWPQPLPPVVHSRLVSIHAAQGPPDRSPPGAGQKPAAQLPSANGSGPMHPSVPTYDGHARVTSHDYSYRPTMTMTGSGPSPESRSQQALSTPPQIAPTYASSSSSRQHVVSAPPQPQATTAAKMLPSSSNSTYNSQTRPGTYNYGAPPPEHALSPSGESSLLSPLVFGPQPMATPMPSNSSSLPHPDYGRPPSVVPASALPPQMLSYTASHGQGGSPKSIGRPPSVMPAQMTNNGTSQHTQGGSPKSQAESRHSPTQALQPGSMSRAPSNNSTHSPGRGASLQVPAAAPPGAFPTGPVGRTPSNMSSMTETGASHHGHAQPSNSNYAPSAPAALATPMYSSVQNSSSTSRASHAPSMSSNQPAVSSSHLHPQSQASQLYSQPHPQSSSSSPNNSSTVQNALPRTDILQSVSAPSPAPASFSGNLTQQQYPTHPHLPTQNRTHNYVTGSSYPQAQPQSQPQPHASSSSNYIAPSSYPHSPNSQPQSSYPGTTDSARPSHTPSAVPSSQSNYSTSAVYGGPPSPRPAEPLYQTQQQNHQDPYVIPKPAAIQQSISQVTYSGSEVYDNSRTPRPSDPTPNVNRAASTSYDPAVHPSTGWVRPSDPTSRSTNSAYFATSTRQSTYGADTPNSAGPASAPSSSQPYFQQGPPPQNQSIAQPVPIRSQNVASSTSTRVPLPGYQPTHDDSSRLHDFDSPPPLSPSTSSGDSHDEILMTPSSFDPTRGQPQEISVSMQRPEKKRGGIFGLFRSSSGRSMKERDQGESKDLDHGHSQTPGPSRGNKLRSTRQPPVTLPAAAMVASSEIPGNAEIESSPSNNNPAKLPGNRKPIPPPIAIPAQDLHYRLVSSKTKQFRAMSVASLEALDGTANNTVVGSPTSTVRSPTPSGPLTPPIRDPVEAAHEWRNNEEKVFNDRGAHRRRRPGVTFDLMEDIPKSSGNYRLARASRLYQQRSDSSE